MSDGTDGTAMTDLAADAGLAADLVREAGTLAWQMRRQEPRGLRTEHKTSVSDVVTAADRAVERLVTDHLAAFRPDDGVLGEEGASRSGSSGRTWVIDPVDGTYNFVQGLAWWCSAVALVGPSLRQAQDDATSSGTGNDVLLGAIYHPHDDVLFVGGPGLPSTRNGAPMPALVDRALAQSCASTYLHPPFHAPGPIRDAFSRAVSGAATLRMLGSGSMDHTAVAQGQMGVLFQHSVADWDWFPGSAIVRGVGGAARRVRAAGVQWSVSGAPTAVAEVCAALEAS